MTTDQERYSQGVGFSEQQRYGQQDGNSQRQDSGDQSRNTRREGSRERQGHPVRASSGERQRHPQREGSSDRLPQENSDLAKYQDTQLEGINSEERASRQRTPRRRYITRDSEQDPEGQTPSVTQPQRQEGPMRGDINVLPSRPQVLTDRSSRNGGPPSSFQQPSSTTASRYNQGNLNESSSGNET